MSIKWRAWIAHVEYFAAMMAWSFTDATVATLQTLMATAQGIFISISDYRFMWKPKNHWTQHIPSDIIWFGPPRKTWCMRYEAKNQEHKRSAQRSNFHDAAQSIAKFWIARSRRLALKRATTETGDDIDEHFTEPFNPEQCKHHELLRSFLVKYPRPMKMPNTITWLKTWNHLGYLITPGQWLLVECQIRKAVFLVRVINLLTTGKSTFLTGRAYTPSAVMSLDSDGLRSAAEEDLNDDSQSANQTFSLQRSAICILLAYLFLGRRRFIRKL